MLDKIEKLGYGLHRANPRSAGKENSMRFIMYIAIIGLILDGPALADKAPKYRRIGLTYGKINGKDLYTASVDSVNGIEQWVVVWGEEQSPAYTLVVIENYGKGKIVYLARVKGKLVQRTFGQEPERP
ncbi:MAG: hypothetical protein Q8P30_00310 [Candidatus Uhrbacteria bacterium]|nr:hypothetical protein [Candidatus Uhrbacteria bacterium]